MMMGQDLNKILEGLDDIKNVAIKMLEGDIYIDRYERELYKQSLNKWEKENLERLEEMNKPEIFLPPENSDDQIVEFERIFQEYCDEFDKEEVRLRLLMIQTFKQAIHVSELRDEGNIDKNGVIQSQSIIRQMPEPVDYTQASISGTQSKTHPRRSYQSNTQVGFYILSKM